MTVFGDTCILAVVDIVVDVVDTGTDVDMFVAVASCRLVRTRRVAVKLLTVSL